MEFFSGVWENKEWTVLKVNQIEEKPTSEFGKDYLGIITGSMKWISR